jgi:hypothetical protein
MQKIKYKSHMEPTALLQDSHIANVRMSGRNMVDAVDSVGPRKLLLPN